MLTKDPIASDKSGTAEVEQRGAAELKELKPWSKKEGHNDKVHVCKYSLGFGFTISPPSGQR